jgi:hypothetical protein
LKVTQTSSTLLGLKISRMYSTFFISSPFPLRKGRGHIRLTLGQQLP